MFEGGHEAKETKSESESPDSKVTASEKKQEGFENLATKVGELFSDDVEDDCSSSYNSAETMDSKELDECNDSEDSRDAKPSIKDLFEQLFSDDFIDSVKNIDNNNDSDNADSNVEKVDPIAEKIAKSIGTPEGIKELIDKHPEKAELWKSQLEALDTLNDPDASPAEIRSAQAKLSNLKGQLMEVAVKDALAESGFDVEAQQRVVDGESGGTRSDVVATNNTDHPIEVFGMIIQPGETISVECKCGGTQYMTNQLNNHIPNQLSGQEGTKVLLTTFDVNGAPEGLASSVCSKYGAKLVSLDISVANVEDAIKEVAEG